MPCVNDLSPIVSVQQNFDSLLIEPSHVSRSKSDTYYLNQKQLLRTHSSAHQSDLIRLMFEVQHSAGSEVEQGLADLIRQSKSFCVAADVYRRDEIDAVHYPVFHQMEGVKMFQSTELFDRTHVRPSLSSDKNPIQSQHLQYSGKVNHVATHLQETIEMLMRKLFQQNKLEMRWVDGYFPFTSPSYELEVFWDGKWIEVCGCGVIQQQIIKAAAPMTSDDTIGWAFGLGLERIAMTLFDIPDIRYFWSKDERFNKQFVNLPENSLFKFQPISKYPYVYKDVSFWLPEEFHENDFCEVVRQIAGDYVENVQLIDSFKHPKTNKQSRCYRIMYRAMDRSLLNSEIDVFQDQLRDHLTTAWKLQLR